MRIDTKPRPMPPRKAELFLFLFAAAAIACGLSGTQLHPTSPIDDAGLLGTPSCIPPCFLGITPGATSEQQALGILEQEDIAARCESFDMEGEGGLRGLICGDNLVVSFGRFTDIVDVIGYYPSGPPALAEVITTYGEPSWVRVQQDGIPEVIRSVAMLFFDGLNTRLTLPTIDGGSYHIGPSAPVENIVYFSTATYQQMTDTSVVSWNGYGDYSQLSPP